MSSVRSVLPQLRRRVAAGVAAAGSLFGVAVVAAPAARADAAPGPHDPRGSVSAVKAVPGGLQFTGWAYDPDTLTANVDVVAIVDGRGINFEAPTSLPNATVQKKYRTGPTPGFQATVPVDTTKAHTVCLAVRNAGAGYHTNLKCVVTPLGTTLTSAQQAAHNPRGALTGFSVSSTSLRIRGWATDPDWITHKLVAVLYVDGYSTVTTMTRTYPTPRPTGAGGLSAFDITVPVAAGAHLGCMWIVNLGLGTGNTFLGCRSGDTRGAAGTAPVTAPAINNQVATEAKKHIGQSYVWGATGPKTFDCSGLVQYSYKKFGFTTPRVSQDQFRQARLIPASRAVPGDLVFYHDTEGDVYHVGIYLSPGKTVAAIDESEGVNYQMIWDPSSATYGSFTHS
jgi:cell wall-associated NlpC family hydrolase